VLFYGTAGGAFGDIRANVDPTWTHQNKAGWTAGAGVEAAFADNWMVRVEYLFVDLQNAAFTSSVTPATVKFDANIVRAGLIYKFR
jgi:outer membrane immunogenic protein